MYFDWLTDCLTDEERDQMTIRQWPGDQSETAYSGIKCWVGTANTGSFQSAILQNCIDTAVAAGARVFYDTEGFGSTELAGMPGAYQPEGIISTVFDSGIEEQLKVQPLGHMSYDYANMDFASLQEQLDEALENFVATVERYNELCEKGCDEDFGKDARLMFPVKNPPFYGYCGTKQIGVIMVTTSGLVVDEFSRVLGNDYRPIKGLFAAGNASGSRFGWQYFTSIAGESLSLAQTQGMMAGEFAATGKLSEGEHVHLA